MSMIHNNHRGIKMVHETDAIPVIQDILKNLNFSLVVEFGTSWGGMTSIIDEAIPKVEIHSFDRPNANRQPDKGWFKENTHNVTFHSYDIFDEGKEVIIELLSRDDFKLLYCDNGKKPREFEMYAPYLNVGDYIGVHDFKDSNEYKKIDILGLQIIKKFVPYKHEIFEMNNWTTRYWKKIK